MRDVVVVLAAGGGTRFAGPEHKLRSTFRGRPLVSWAIEAAVGGAQRAGVELVAVVTGAVDLADLLPDGVVEVANPDWEAGQATSLGAALDWARSEAADRLCVGLGDTPLVPADAWRLVLEADGDLVTASFDGEWRPPVRIDRSLWGHLPRTGDRGAGQLLAGRSELVTAVACEGDAADVDTVEDLRSWN